MKISIDAYLTPFFPEPESLFDNTIVIMIDVLRASTTIVYALNNGAKEVIPSDSLEKAIKIYNNLNKEVRFLGGERNNIKPSGFDAGNSPTEYLHEVVADKSIILTTTNGTRIFMKAKQAKHRIVASFANKSAVLENILKNLDGSQENKIIFLCSGNGGRLSYEDTLCAGALIFELDKRFSDVIKSDTALAASNLYCLHSKDLISFLKNCEHAKRLIDIGFESDVDLCLKTDTCPVVPIVGTSSIKKA